MQPSYPACILCATWAAPFQSTQKYHVPFQFLWFHSFPWHGVSFLFPLVSPNLMLLIQVLHRPSPFQLILQCLSPLWVPTALPVWFTILVSYCLLTSLLQLKHTSSSGRGSWLIFQNPQRVQHRAQSKKLKRFLLLGDKQDKIMGTE